MDSWLKGTIPVTEIETRIYSFFQGHGTEALLDQFFALIPTGSRICTQMLLRPFFDFRPFEFRLSPVEFVAVYAHDHKTLNPIPSFRRNVRDVKPVGNGHEGGNNGNNLGLGLETRSKGGVALTSSSSHRFATLFAILRIPRRRSSYGVSS